MFEGLRTLVMLQLCYSWVTDVTRNFGGISWRKIGIDLLYHTISNVVNIQGHIFFPVEGKNFLNYLRRSGDYSIMQLIFKNLILIIIGTLTNAIYL